jgi:hypothetical protein
MQQMLPRRPEPEGIWIRAAAQPHRGCTAIAALLVVDDVTASPPPRALRPNAPCARPLLILGQAPGCGVYLKP